MYVEITSFYFLYSLNVCSAALLGLKQCKIFFINQSYAHFRTSVSDSYPCEHRSNSYGYHQNHHHHTTTAITITATILAATTTTTTPLLLLRIVRY